MRKTATTINPALSRVISETGHTDLIVVTDAGLPIPTGSERIDLAYRPGAPAFFDVLAEKSPEVLEALRERFADQPFEIDLIPHVEFKALSQNARAFVRSGEFTPYANVILHAGVAY